VTSVAAREHGEWQGKLTPMLLELPGEKSGKPRVFPVAVDRVPSGRPLAKE
jgi:hypothetical protein